MSPFYEEGSYTSESREVAVSETWDTWSNPQSSSNVEVVDGSLQLAEVTGPQSTVSRPADNASTGNEPRGIVINPNVEWPEMDARISQNTENMTTATVYETATGTQVWTGDISSLSSGDVFTIDATLSADTDYSIMLSGGTPAGLYNSPSFPYTSDDVDIVAGADGGDETAKQMDYAPSISEVGNIQ